MVTVRCVVAFDACASEFDAWAVGFDVCAVEVDVCAMKFDVCGVDDACDDEGCTCDDEGGGPAAGMTWNVYVGAVCRVFAGCTSMGRLDGHSDGLGMGQLSEAVCWRYASAFCRSSMGWSYKHTDLVLVWYGAGRMESPIQ